MSGIHGDLADVLLGIEREMRLLGRWSSQIPSAQALASTQPFCIDTLSFDEWLQFVFIVRVTGIIEAAAPLPQASGIAELAEEVYREHAECARLISHLRAFDQCILRSRQGA